jgi:micrococcal nuclease
MKRMIIGLLGIGAIVSTTAILAQKDPTTVDDLRVIDGDSFVLNGERVRLNGVDTAEAPGHCRPGRKCVEGDWELARLNLAYALTFGDLTVERLKLDRYGRTVAQVSAGTLDVSCYMLRTGNAVYKRQWDEGARTRNACPELAR